VPCSNYISRLACGFCVIRSVVAQLDTARIRLAWDADDTQPVFNIYRSVDPDVPQVPQNLLGSTADTTFLDTTGLQLPETKFFYTVTMQDSDTNAVDVTQP
jgi:hypothetical protein